MKGLAKVSRGEGAIELVDRPQPDPAPDEVLVNVEYAGLCGSDVGIYRFKPAFERMELPTVIGHEYAGTVVERGADVTTFQPGDPVVERPIRPCGNCHQCQSGEENVCQDIKLTGIDHDGAFEPYLTAPADVLHSVPKGMNLKHAALMEPTAINTRAIIENSRVSAGDAILVEGPGPMGLLAAQVARTQGADVLVSGVNRDASHRLELARELGFETINVDATDLAHRRSERTDGIGFDVVIDTTGHPSGLETAARSVRKGGQIVLVGQSGEATLDYSPMVRAELDVQCSYGATYADFERARRLIENEQIQAGRIIDDRFSLLAAEAAFEAFDSGETVKPVFDVSELAEAN